MRTDVQVFFAIVSSKKKKKVIFADGFTRKVLADPINRSYPKKNCFLPFVRVFFQNFLLLWKMEKMVKIYYEENKRVIDDTRKNYNSFLVHNGSSWSTTSAHENQNEETRPEPSRKEESGILVLSKTSSWVN